MGQRCGDTVRITTPKIKIAFSGIVRDIFRFRSFIIGSIRRDIQSQYQGSLLGGTWVILQPLAMIAIYTLVFSNVMRSRLPGIDAAYGYSIYLCAGVLTWGYFSEGLTRLQGVFIANSNLLKKAAFPRICLPLIAIGTASFNFFIIFTLFLLFLLFGGNWPGWTLLALLAPLIVQIILTTGVGILAATLNVFFRDIGQLVNVGLLFWFWLTPIVYPISVLPDWTQGWLWLNPFSILMHHYQQILLMGQLPDALAWQRLALLAVFAVLLLAWGWKVYRVRAPEMADEL